MLNKKGKFLAVMLGSLMLSACASIVSDSNYLVAVNSTPAGASFVVTNENGQQVHSGTTPTSINLEASSGFFNGEEYSITLKKEGYSDQIYTLSSSVDGWYIGNILFGGLIGLLIIDPATGAMYKLPKRVDVSLSEAVASGGNSALTIATLDELTDAQKSQLIAL